MSSLSYERKRKTIGVVFVLPAIILLIVFKYYPMILSIIRSFTNWSLYEPKAEFVGLKNYIRIFTDMPEFWKALMVNIRYSMITTVLQLVIGFLMAYMLFNLTKRWKEFFKVSLYLPVILPSATLGVMWTFLLSPDYGLVNTFLRSINLDFLTHAWLAEPGTALGTVIFVTLWKFSGFTMVIYYIAMLNISGEILESAKVDGANGFRQVIHFFIPLTMNATETNFILTMIGGMKAFDMFYLLTGGGPGTETTVTAMLIYKHAFVSGRFDRATAMAVVTLVIVMTMTIIGRRLLKSDD